MDLKIDHFWPNWYPCFRHFWSPKSRIQKYFWQKTWDFFFFFFNCYPYRTLFFGVPRMPYTEKNPQDFDCLGSHSTILPVVLAITLSRVGKSTMHTTARASAAKLAFFSILSITFSMYNEPLIQKLHNLLIISTNISFCASVIWHWDKTPA